MTICNACRYCEGHCAVFPAMEMRTAFQAADLTYLANLCHNCGACYHHCQYAPPHEFAVNVPRTFATLRHQSYRDHAWPAAFARLYDDNGLAVVVMSVIALFGFMAGAALWIEPAVLFGRHDGNFYAVMSHGAMVGLFGAVALFVLLAFVMGFRSFWRETARHDPALREPGALAHALHDTFTLRYLDGGAGDGCTSPTATPSPLRRRFHHATFYGFMLCFAATSVGTIYHYGFGWVAPYGYLSLPVILGTVGGIGLVVGPIGLLWLRRRRDPGPTTTEKAGMEVGFLVLLLLTSVTGLALLALRETAAMGTLLLLHLAVVLALFASLPYGKFMHGIYRFAALVKYSFERESRDGGPGG
jgi:citrate/tricarballylate utilization protein